MDLYTMNHQTLLFTTDINVVSISDAHLVNQRGEYAWLSAAHRDHGPVQYDSADPPLNLCNQRSKYVWFTLSESKWWVCLTYCTILLVAHPDGPAHDEPVNPPLHQWHHRGQFVWRTASACCTLWWWTSAPSGSVERSINCDILIGWSCRVIGSPEPSTKRFVLH